MAIPKWRQEWDLLLGPWWAGEWLASGERKLHCPFHNDDKASASVNRDTMVWKCHSCADGGRATELIGRVEDVLVAQGGSASQEPAKIANIGAQRAKRGGDDYADDAAVQRWHAELAKLPAKAHLDYLLNDRGLTIDSIRRYKIGYDPKKNRLTIPVRDEHGALVNVRRYRRNPTGDIPKMTNVKGMGSPARLFPAENLVHDRLILCEGEWDAIVTTQSGVPAVTGTHGARTFPADLARKLAGKDVYVVFDCDEAGRIGAKEAAEALARHARRVAVVDLGLDEGQDLTDYWNALHGAADLEALLLAAPVVSEGSEGPEGGLTATEVAPATVQVIGSMDATKNGRPMQLYVTISGRKDPTFSVPKSILYTCNQDSGIECQLCPMATRWDGEHEHEVKGKDVTTIIEMLTERKQIKTTLRKAVGIPAKCKVWSWTPEESRTVEELFCINSLDQGEGKEADYTARRIYNVGQHDTRTNTTAKVVGTTVPNPSTGRNEFVAWDLEEAHSSLDGFHLSPSMQQRLRVFQPEFGQSPLHKMREIARDLSANVTHIVGRERLHMAFDIMWHSVLHFPIGDHIISRGWVEFLVVGDTRTGKSETAIRLRDHYQLGHVINGENTSFAGLVGGVKQVGESWVVSWGEITLNDRRAVILDEASGLKPEIISQLSDVRSRGIAQVTKIESQMTRARCRMAWISNPRPQPGGAPVDGVAVVENLIGNPEDIARFDLAMSVRSSDVPKEKINELTHEEVPHVYTSELCRELILWAWSRRPEQVCWADGSLEHCFAKANEISDVYVERPPLIQAANVREKIARIAVAIAARCYSADEKGELLLVYPEHVDAAVAFMDELYSYRNFGYRAISERILKNAAIARESRDTVRAYLKDRPRLLDFLVGRRESFRVEDLVEMAGLTKETANMTLSTLSAARMIDKQKSQVVLEPEFVELLREMET